MAGAIFVGVLVLAVAGVAVKILAAVRAATARNRAFLETAIVAVELPPDGSERAASFQPASSTALGVWLDLLLDGPTELPFALWLSVRLGSTVLVEESFPVTFDDEGDAHGMPACAGGMALNTSSRALLSRMRMATVLRAYRFDVPSVAAPGEVRVRLTPGAGVTITRARLLVTPKDSPPL